MVKKLKATAKSPANIAFIKYWGKADPKTRVPQNSSISMSLSRLYSICTVEFEKGLKKDKIDFLKEKVIEERELRRIKNVLDRARELVSINLRARVMTVNNFPKATGIASSASGLSAVTLAVTAALGLKLSQRELSKLARLASGTASRSIPDGFVEWRKGTDESNSYAVQIFPPDWWDIRDVVAIVSREMKKVKSTQGHALAPTSPFYRARITGMPAKIKAIKRAIKKKDFTAFGEILEKECLNMHAICITSQPPILYWQGVTMEIMRKVQEWREDGLEIYFTIDAGPTVHLICQGKNEKEVVKRLKKIKGIERISVNKPSIGARVIDSHLF